MNKTVQPRREKKKYFKMCSFLYHGTFSYQGFVLLDKNKETCILLLLSLFDNVPK